MYHGLKVFMSTRRQIVAKNFSPNSQHTNHAFRQPIETLLFEIAPWLLIDKRKVSDEALEK